MIRRTLACSLILVLCAACWNPLRPSLNGSFSWSADGQSFSATSDGFGALRASGGTVILTGVDCRGGAGLSILFNSLTAAETYSTDAFSATYTPDGRTGDAAGTNWEARAGKGAGTVTIANLSDGRVAGSFTLQMSPGIGSPATGMLALQGNFDVPFHDRAIC